MLKTGRGPFLLMSDKDFDRFEHLRSSLPGDLLLSDVPLLYFLSVCDEKVEVLYYSKKVVRLVPSAVADKYKQWLDDTKVRLNLV